jgi:catechol 2,3-dioxygenase-like lactoylglutathione lyase family enzyme
MTGSIFKITKVTLSTALFLTALSAINPTMSFAQDLPGLSGASLSHISLNATNVDAMMDFYMKKLGFAIETQGKSPEMGGKRFVYLKLNDFIIELVEAEKDVAHDPLPKNVLANFAKPGFGHIGLRVGDLDVAVEELKNRGVKLFFPPQTYTLVGAPYQRNSAFVMDPEGNILELGESPDVQEKQDNPTPSKKKK